MINEQLKKRLLSFTWRTLAMCAVVILNEIVILVADIGLSPLVITLVGLACGELTKYLNAEFQLGSKLLGKK